MRIFIAFSPIPFENVYFISNKCVIGLFLYWPKKPVVNCFIFMRVFLELVKRGGIVRFHLQKWQILQGIFFGHKSSRLFIRVSKLRFENNIILQKLCASSIVMYRTYKWMSCVHTLTVFGASTGHIFCTAKSRLTHVFY